MKVSGYKVEFLPLERRLLERRFIDSAPCFFDYERRFNERRIVEGDVFGADQGNEPETKPALTH